MAEDIRFDRSFQCPWLIYFSTFSREKEEANRLKREIALMTSRLMDAENRMNQMKQMHEQQNKKIVEIEDEKVKTFKILVFERFFSNF